MVYKAVRLQLQQASLPLSISGLLLLGSRWLAGIQTTVNCNYEVYSYVGSDNDNQVFFLCDEYLERQV